VTFRRARAEDADAVADLHALSWRATYRGILRDEFLDGPVLEERQAVWRERLADAGAADSRFVLLAEQGGELHAFVCAILDADPTWGALLDNLHVVKWSQGKGLGRILMAEASLWIRRQRPGSRMHLWVFEKNVAALRFYDRLGGGVIERRAIAAPDGLLVESVCYGWKDLSPLVEGP
jgi:ribosomal protein S18 acetylase RimI-like enzyme